jgi:D-alanyl-lipoteichoic acid acyltransferase DltB (MBOAT superfamily)
MAIGLGRMFGVKLPLNFHSPLRAACIIDYWRRWHMTLQRFIVAYIFAPLSLPMNRLAAEKDLRRWAAFAVGVATPTFATFVTIGVWHGAGWTYALFGAMHAFYVCVNEAWRERRKLLKRKLKRAGRTLAEPRLLQLGAYHLLTLTAVAYANVMFRAHSAGDAVAVWAGMSGLGGAGAIPPSVDYLLAILLALSAAIVFLAPNTQQIMGRFDPAQNWDEWRDVGRPLLAWTWKPSIAGLAFAGAVLFFGLMFIQNGQATFLYFKF